MCQMEPATVEGNDKQSPIFRDIRRYYCEHCGICRSKKSLIRSHILSHHKDEVQGTNLDEDNAHKKVGQKVRHACQECGASFWKPAYLLQHMRSHSVERPFACPVEECHSSYQRKDHLNRHLLKHQGRVFNCPVQNCNIKFAFRCNIKRHVKELHDGEAPCEGEKQHVCLEPGCGKIFKYASKLRKHEDSHVKLDCLEIICGEVGCMKPFTNAKCLRAHIQSCHKYARCEVCGTQLLKRNLRLHQRSHEAAPKKRIKCTFEGCGLTFSNKPNLNKHVKAVHDGLRPFRCRTSGCQEKFPYRHVRDNHEKTHEFVQVNFLEADEQWRSRNRGGRKRRGISVEMLTRKRVVGSSSVLDDGAGYLRWMFPDQDEDEE